MSKYYFIHEFSKIVGVSAQTLRNWDVNGKIGYCRVSNYKQKDDLERQIDNTEKSQQQELVEDLVQIITVFSCKLQGKPANKAKELIRELIQEEVDGKSHKSHKSNVDTKQCTENEDVSVRRCLKICL